ncbi:uncharacterized protein BP5553_04420 [Venustampulla echinocandica]|uniref:Uncharacterized protein n=1 Tax=Venustampulla echinocandica TaxID=2656787 RepID=A0A370TN86_9HELO|nr:uncharacterized protein BP5553_04420 [Venustampulla echinocandica]RDL36987.1 hypothetical protein BP5553_04420 [Venustampulla echinocandica]
MTIKSALAIFGILATTLASPLVTRETPVEMSLETREDKCYPNSMVDNKKMGNCPHKTNVDKDGHCPNINRIPGREGCSAYCELTLSKGYGQEIPFHQGYCQAKTTCSVANSESVATTQTWSVNANIGMGTGEEVSKALSAVFNIGASYSQSKTLTYTVTTTQSKELGKNQCGYWTFIPFVMESCGTLTSVTKKTMTAGYYNTNTVSYCDTKGSKADHKNWCNKSIYKDDKGRPDGQVVFIFVDCAHGGILKDNKIPGGETQPAAIWYPGVSTGPK